MRPKRVNTSLPGHYSRVRVLLLAPCEQCGFLLGLLLHALWLLSTW